MTKEDVLAALRVHVLPLFQPKTSIAIVVTAPSKAEQIGDNLQSLGFKVEHRELTVDPNELEGSGSDSGSSSEGDHI